jgi:hypothetical protein
MNRDTLRVTRALAACITALLCAVACANAGGEVTLPPKALAASHSNGKSAGPSPREQVISAYTGYIAALTPADDSRDPAMVRVMLMPFISASAVRGWIRTFAALWRRHEVSFGTPAVRIFYVRVIGNRAVIRACENTTGGGLKNYLTGNVVPGSNLNDSTHLYQVTVLHREAGQWDIGTQTFVDLPCLS